MDIAMVNPALIDARLDRINRLVSGIDAFKERLDHMWNAYGPSNQQQPVYDTPQTQAYSVQPELTSDISPISADSTAKVTADDVDIDAILNDIDLSGDFTL